MKQIIFSIITVGFLAVSCGQKEDISGKIEAAVKQKANRMVDSLKRVCDKNFDTQLQSRVDAAIKSNNQLTAAPKPSVKPKTSTATKPKTTTASTKPAQKPGARGGRAGNAVKSGGLLKSKTVTKPATTSTRSSTTTTKPATTTPSERTKTIRNRPGVKNKKDDNN